MDITDIVLWRHEIPGAEEFRRRGWWEGRLIVDYVDDHALRTPHKVALVDSRGALTYGDIRARTRNLAAALLELGLQPGDVVAVQAPNWSELVLAHLALDRVGMIFVRLHDGFREHEMRHLLALSNARAIIYPPSFRGFDHRALLAHIQPILPKLRHHIVLRAEPAAGEHGFDALAGDGGWEARRGPDFLERHRPSSSSPLEVMVSSGTTALPRCSLFCDDAMLHLIRHQYGQQSCRLTEHDVAVSIAPAGTGATGYIFPIVTPLLFGAKSVLLERWDGNDPGLALDLMEEHAATYVVLFPTQLGKLVAAQRERPRHIPSLRFISNAGAKLPDSVA
jgi:non-ribosomal peptide synthetase component E (peptide arylation enzyme)